MILIRKYKTLTYLPWSLASYGSRRRRIRKVKRRKRRRKATEQQANQKIDPRYEKKLRIVSINSKSFVSEFLFKKKNTI